MPNIPIVRPCDEDWTVPALFIHFTEVIKEIDKRYEQRFEAQEKALGKAENSKQLIVAYLVRSLGHSVRPVSIIPALRR